MRATSIVFKRELLSYLRSPVGYVVAALALLITGILFQTQALGKGAKLSADVLSAFFYNASGLTMVMGVVLAVHLVAQERQQNSIVLLNTSPVRDVEIIIGKFFAALVFLALILALTAYMPLLIKVRGKITYSQLFAGYLGLLLLGSASLAIGLFASTLGRQLLVVLVVGFIILAIMILLYPMADKIGDPFRDVLQELAFWHRHFGLGFQKGILNLKDIVYYLAVTYFFLLLATKTMEAKRWR